MGLNRGEVIVVETQVSGYGLYWKRIARHLSLSQVAKQLGVRAGDLSALEQGKDHPMTDEQVGAYAALLESIAVEEAPEPEPSEDA